jgi:cyclic beta-1,2-glucan synthetase
VELGVLTAFFSKQDDARKVFGKLKRRSFRRVALIHKTEQDVVTVHDRFWWYRSVWTALAVLFFLLLFGGPLLLLHFFAALVFPPAWLPYLLVLIAGLGGLVGWLWANRSRFGVEPDLIQRYSRSLLPGESLLILQAHSDVMQLPVQTIRGQSEQLPSIFVLHASREKRQLGRDVWVALSRDQIQERALYQAIDHHQLSREKQKNTELLKRLKRSRGWFHDICHDLAGACRLEQGVSPVAEWIIDNEFVVASTVRDVLQNLPLGYYRELPTIAGDTEHAGLPFIYGLAKELVSDTELRLDRDNILSFLETYQSIRSLSTAELWAIPQMLRIALVESIQSLAITTHSDLRGRQLAALWANRLIAAERKAPEHIQTILAELELMVPSPYFCTQLVDHLFDEEALLVPVEAWIERLLDEPLNECTLREQNRQSRAQISISNAFTSLRRLTQFDWREIFEQVSRIERVLRFDPAGVYALMDFETRDRYRRVVEDFAQKVGQPEEDVAHCAIELATQAAARGISDERMDHVGTYLVGVSRHELAGTIKCREPVRWQLKDWTGRHHTGLYLFSVGMLTALFLALLLQLGLPETTPARGVLFALLGLIPVSQMALQIVNFMVTHCLSPRVLPKMDFEKSGIPDQYRTLVVVPTLLAGEEMLRNEVEKLEIRYMANREDNLVFSLFTDFVDASQPLTPEDQGLLELAIALLEGLNQRHGSGRFLLFHRQRIWSESEQKYIGKERKRGKLEELNRLLVDQHPQDVARLVHAGDPAALDDIRFVITLDSDTQLPHGTARRMIETLAHPLNRPRFDDDGKVCAGSYTIIQPRVSPSLASSGGSGYSRFFADAAGIDPYTKAVSDVYQDLSGQGSYHGKGIYDVRAFSRVLDNQFPEERILSHDLIEGEYVRVGLASDIELYDEFPQSYQSDVSRLHRWIRGDWQIAGWLLPRIPLADGQRGPNPLSLFSRWKIFDNLRRSLLPVASVALLLAAWLTDSRIGLAATLVIAVQVFFHPLAQLHAIVTSRAGLKSFSPSRMKHNLLRAAIDAALLPHQAMVALDAILRVCYRCTVSKRHLLAWTSAQLSTAGPRVFALYLFVVSPWSLLVGVFVYLRLPHNLVLAGPLLLLWLLSPLLVWLLSHQRSEREAEAPLAEPDIRFLRTVARRTWRYFADFVDDRTSWLPPDNYQESHQDKLAMRTSPTNIGLWMLSVQAAQDSGYVSPATVLEKLTRTMASIDRLERHEGHLLNWYEIEHLQPLEPRYVSSVDSGNLLGSLWTLEHGLEELQARPLIDRTLISGLWDVVRLVQQTSSRQQLERLQAHGLEALLSGCADPPESLAELLERFRQCETLAARLSAPDQAPAEGPAGENWLPSLCKQLDDWRLFISDHLGWAELLMEKTEEERAQLGAEAAAAIGDDLTTALSLRDLGQGRSAARPLLAALQQQGGVPADLSEWVAAVLDAFTRGQQAAGRLLEQAERLAEKIRLLSTSINMGFLFSAERKLFAVGYNVSAGRLDNAYYDLLASESRFGSFVAIARGEVPMEHWFALGRPYGKIGYSRALLSWTGTMFEYLMPIIFQYTYDNSLLDRATRQAVAEQIKYEH